MPDQQEITMVEGTIHNPDDPRHFAKIRELDHEVIASCGDTEIARSNKALKLLEVGHDLYDPVYYFLREHVEMDLLKRIEKTTHCPLKGDTDYFDLEVDGERITEAAWSYTRTYDPAKVLTGYIAFDPTKVQVTEYTVKK